MTRLTEKIDNKVLPYDMKKQDNLIDYIIKTTTKLGQYEDIDEELGITYEIIYKCATQGFYEKVYVFNEPRYVFTYAKYVDFENKKLVRISYNDWDETYSEKEYLFENYGKTWSLRKEDLER